MTDLKAVGTHFAFGENWSAYAKQIDEVKIAEAEKGLLKLISKEELSGKTFLDIGCGSGLHALAALRLGASYVLATDIDSDSVSTTTEVLKNLAPQNARYDVKEVSVFDLNKQLDQQFDIVYSWGVLHHTGDMYNAISEASKSVQSDGVLILALYRQTPMCSAWKHIKRWYTRTNKKNQRRAQTLYIWLYKLRFIVTGKNFGEMRENYYNSRGMSFEHDVHDWLGGYPYESITPAQLREKMQLLGFEEVRTIIRPKGFGFFGSWCDEYIYKNRNSHEY